ncbi:GNAT family N-acetyltransferase [Brevibacillus sp. M2.1A]|uniref:GNAT family N-acetyltransferase n=1 Tax=Brevibacillus TaxID=55080 RepID=UPI0007D8B21E|nr:MULTISPECIES: GNAT family N-acetyltransferase [Brevibacillus]MBY0086361.1 GNAT family N-acetyltransferase [Brevibacillus brevis]MCC8437943.1 GNAT family N-acetyltransferase [Brevibacillus sp. M2.1A]MCE0453228.1 GNAT family N-acetyltransferase [Brevibacillus sp. AF8]UKL00047.1 GNAT family N-acetyltransferase [Brevibacillus brevis]WGV58954.1 GNAT family N-acetyltransferase [Brevibacillus brevis]
MKGSKLKSGQNVIIRSAELADAEALVAFIHCVSGETDNLSFGPQEWTVTPDEQKENIKRCLEAHNQLCLIAEVDGRIVGNMTFRGGIRSRTQHVGEFGISVLKEFWGSGVGRLLLESLLEWAKQSKVIRKINLKVRSDNDSAIHLYKKLGFKEMGTLTREFLIGDTFYDCLYMGIEID